MTIKNIEKVDPPSVETSFAEVMDLIRQARRRTFQAVNTGLIDLYWQVGEYLSHRIKEDGWGRGTVSALAVYIQREQPGVRGFSPQNLWRMRQFFETYCREPELSTLLRELPWSAKLHIFTKAKLPEEREFYLRMATRNRWPVREVARQINTGLFERTTLKPPQLSTVLREKYPQAANFFKDTYILEFLGLPVDPCEADLHRGLLRDISRFLTELGRDFCFIGSEDILQVGGRDFALDLLFFHRGLNTLVAVELKVAGQLAENGEEHQSHHRGRGRRRPNEMNQARKAAEKARQAAVVRLKQVSYFHYQARWLTERFPEAELRDVEGLVKLVDRVEIEANDWSLTPGRYIGVAPEEEDPDFDFEQTLRDIHAEPEDLNAEAATLATTIRKNFEELGI